VAVTTWREWSNYPEFWQTLGTVKGKWLGLPVKADVKSIIWYNPANFEALGYQVPTTWAELDALVEQMVADGNVPWSMGLENRPGHRLDRLRLHPGYSARSAGPEYVLNIINGRCLIMMLALHRPTRSWKWASDPSTRWAAPRVLLTTPFRDAIFKIVTDPPEALMVKQSGFAGNEIKTDYPDLQYGTDYDFFQIPDLKGLQGGSDWMMAFSDKPAVQAIFTYLSSDLGAQNWAKEAFGLTPNTAGLSLYDPNTELGKLAGILSGAQGFTPDIGDSIPGGFGTAEWKAIVDYLNGTDLQQALNQAATVQKEALAGQTQ
jgi:alpha-glucoside transport system substrate-binding protein